jgi:hypothetical protein
MFGVLGTGLVGCNKSDGAATALCNQYAAAVCERYFTCGADQLDPNTPQPECPPRPHNLSLAPKKPSWFPPELACATDVDDCTKSLRALECGDVAETVCTSGATYHADKAQACVTGWQSLTCDNVQQATLSDPTAVHQPVECYQICTM